MGAISRNIFLIIYRCLAELDFAVSMFGEIVECLGSFTLSQSIPSQPGKSFHIWGFIEPRVPEKFESFQTLVPLILKLDEALSLAFLT